eukprot:4443290-Pyramimonas_sp.AAC.1
MTVLGCRMIISIDVFKTPQRLCSQLEREPYAGRLGRRRKEGSFESDQAWLVYGSRCLGFRV